jgi:hypothetical protein
MHRISNKKSKQKSNRDVIKTSYINSGNFMTSYIDDPIDDTVEMPIASPDNKYIVQDDETNVVVSSSSLNVDSDKRSDSPFIGSVGSSVSNGSQNNDQEQDISNSNGTLPQTTFSSINQSNNNNNNNNINKDTNTPINNTTTNNDSINDKSNVNNPIETISSSSSSNQNNLSKVESYIKALSQQGSISGGLTLVPTNKSNTSLKNLINYIRLIFSNNLTSPKWKNFKGLNLLVMEKIRLNNILWRTWFEQC